MGEYLNKEGLTRFKEKMLTEVDKRIATGGSTSGGDVPTKEEIIEGASRVTDVEVSSSVATIEGLQTALASLETQITTYEASIAGLESTIANLESQLSDAVFPYKAGDTIKARSVSAGHFTSSGTQLVFVIPFCRPVKATGVSISGLIYARKHGGGYYYNGVDVSTFDEVRVHSLTENCAYIALVKTAGHGVTNNTITNVDLDLTVTFT